MARATKPTIRFKPNVNGTIRQLAEYARLRNIDGFKAVKMSARRIAVNLGYQTQPFGFADSARDMGRKAVSRDFHKVYGTDSSVYGELLNNDPIRANVFYAHMKAGEYMEAQQVLDSFDLPKFSGVQIENFNGSYHDKQWQNGKLHQQRLSQIVEDVGPLNEAIELHKKDVGMAKRGWYDCARKLGRTREFPDWVKEKKPGMRGDAGMVTAVNKGIRSYVDMTNMVRHAVFCLSASGISSAMERERAVLEDLVQRAHRAAKRKAHLE